jgi:hypothetical protein
MEWGLHGFSDYADYVKPNMSPHGKRERSFQLLGLQEMRFLEYIYCHPSPRDRFQGFNELHVVNYCIATPAISTL